MSLNFSKHLTHPVFKVISELVTEKDLEAFVIGGYVRDLILERTSKDIDIVVVGSGLDLAKDCSKKLRVKKVTNYRVLLLQRKLETLIFVEHKEYNKHV